MAMKATRTHNPDIVGFTFPSVLQTRHGTDSEAAWRTLEPEAVINMEDRGGSAVIYELEAQSFGSRHFFNTERIG